MSVIAYISNFFCSKSHLLQLISRCYQYQCAVLFHNYGTVHSYYQKDILEQA